MAYVHPTYHGGKNHPEQVTDEYLTCGLCQVPGFRMLPKILQCGHTFCQPCLENHARNAYLNGMLLCPSCQQPTKIPPGGVAKLCNNLFVDTQVDRLLRCHNQHRGRDDTVYNVSNYRQSGTGKAYFRPQ